MKKSLISALIGLILLLFIIVVGVGLFIGPIIKTGVETLGPRITKVPIKLESVDVSVLGGSAAIKGLVVGNPKGFKTPEAIKLGKAELALDVLSVTGDKVVINKVHVVSPEITFDGGLQGNNLSRIMENVNAAAPKDEAAKSDAPAAGEKGASKPAPKIQVDDFLISGAKVNIHLTGPIGKEMTVPLPDIHLKDLGKDKDGITPQELVRVVLGQINTATLKAVTEAVTSSGKMIEDLGKDVTKGITKEAGGAVKSVTDSVGNLFGK